MFMFCEHKSGEYYDISVGNKSFERVEQFIYLGTILTNQNPIHEEIKSRYKSGNALLSFGAEYFVFQFAIKSLKIEI